MTPTTPSAPDEVVLAPCPFCGASPHQGLTKMMTGQNGEQFQRFRIWCPHGHASFEEMNQAMTSAAWNRRTSPQPAGVTEEQPFDFMSLAAHLAKVNAGREVIERESDGAAFVHRDVCIEAMQALRLPSPTDTRERVLTDDDERLLKLMEGAATAWEAAKGTMTLAIPASSARTLRKAIALINRLKSKPTEAPVEDGWVRVPKDLLTHIGDWETACRIALDHSEPPTVDRDDHSYWEHQLKTLVNIRTLLAASTKEERR